MDVAIGSVKQFHHPAIPLCLNSKRKSVNPDGSHTTDRSASLQRDALAAVLQGQSIAIADEGEAAGLDSVCPGIFRGVVDHGGWSDRRKRREVLVVERRPQN